MPAGALVRRVDGVCREVWSARILRIAPALTVLGFGIGLALTLASSELFARGLTRLGTKLGFSEGLIGLLAALGSDSPELSSAVAALVAGAGSIGVGVIVGSNLFNLAALLGLTAVVAGGITIRRGPLLLDASVGLLVTIVAAAMIAGLFAPAAAAAAVFPIAVVYVLILSSSHRRLGRFAPLLATAPRGFEEIAYDVAHDRPRGTHESWLPATLIPIALAGVVGGSFVMVHEALAARSWLHLSDVVLGTVVLAALTSLPNLWVALHFARTNRGTALFSSAMNSNSINVVGGLIAAGLFIGTAAAKGSLAHFTWLIDLTLLAVLVPLPRKRMSPFTGWVMIAIYLIFVLLQVLGV